MNDIAVFLQHILESINLILNYTLDISKEKFLSSNSIQDMVFRRLEIIGEAVKNLPQDFKDNNLHIEWREIAGLRDVLIHNYFGVDLDLTWKVIEKDIPELKIKIEE